MRKVFAKALPLVGAHFGAHVGAFGPLGAGLYLRMVRFRRGRAYPNVPERPPGNENPELGILSHTPSYYLRAAHRL